MKASPVILAALFVFVSAFVSVSVSALELEDAPVQRAMNVSLSTHGQLASLDKPFATGGDFGERSISEKSGSKSLWQAAAYSALVPGGGQYYLGKRHKARYFFAAELLTWAGYATLKIYGNWREDDYIAFAAAHANADLEGKSDDFIDLVGFYDDVYDYNRAGRVTDPDRPYYFETTEYYWLWKSSEDRQTFRDLKNSAREADRNANFMIGVAVIDRVISIIDAVRDVRRMNRRIDESFSSTEGSRLKLSVNPFRSRNQIQLTFVPNF